MSQLYLASQSPRRLQLLQQLGLQPALLLPDADEDAESLEILLAGEAPAAYVQRVTQLKLGAALQRRARRGLASLPVLCADTTVALDAQILGKPADEAQARQMLRALAGRSHWVHTAVGLADAQGRVHAALSSSQVWVAPLSDTALQRYLASGEPFGKAGAYAIQGAFAAHVVRIEGSHSGIMGLPLHETAALLTLCGLDL